MSGGIGFSRDAQASFERNRNLRSNKAPFQRAEENKFLSKMKKRKNIITKKSQKLNSNYLELN